MAQNIMIAVDGSKTSSDAMVAAGQLLKELSDCNAILLHCAQPSWRSYPKEIRPKVNYPGRLPVATQEKVADKILGEAKNTLLDNGFPKERLQLKVKLNSENPAEDILKEVESEKINTVVLGRRYLTPMQRLAFGSVSSKVAQSSPNRTVWIVDTPVEQTKKVLVAVDGSQESRILTYYVTENIAAIPGLHFTLLHILPQLPPSYWDDGHILNVEEQEERQVWKEEWRTQYVQKVQKYLTEARDYLIARGVLPENVETRITPARHEISSHLATEITQNNYHMVVIGKRSFHKERMFQLGSHANKVLYNARNTILCMVDSH